MEHEKKAITNSDSEMVDKSTEKNENASDSTSSQACKEACGDVETGIGKVSESDIAVAKKKRGRRNRPKGGGRHQWKPYDELNWVQRRKLEERETKRATKKREAAFESGHAIAPYNTTQFLIEDHLQNGQSMSPDLELKIPTCEERDRKVAKSVYVDIDSDSSNDELNDSPTDEIFLAKDFTEAYSNIHAERLHTMSKSELIKEYIILESKVEFLEEKLKDCAVSDVDFDITSVVDVNRTHSVQPSTVTFLNEIVRLQKENKQLRAARDVISIDP